MDRWMDGWMDRKRRHVSKAFEWRVKNLEKVSFLNN